MKPDIQITKNEEPKPFKLINGTDDQFIEPSGVETIDEEGKYLLVIDDKAEELSPFNLRVVEATEGIVRAQFTLPQAPKKPKWEAITKDSEGFFYLIGSHAAKDGDSADKLAKRSHLFRFRLKMNEDPSKIAVDEDSVIEFDIKPSLKALKIYTELPSEKNVKIEGLALKTMNGKKYLIFGLREPSSLIEIYAAEIPAVIDNEVVNLPLKSYFRFAAGTTVDKVPFKLSSIDYVPDWRGFLILTSSETTEKATNGKDLPVFHGNALWFVSDELIGDSLGTDRTPILEPIQGHRIADFEASLKAEGLCVITTEDKNTIRLAIVFDNDTEDLRKAGSDKILLGMRQLLELTHQNNF